MFLGDIIRNLVLSALKICLYCLPSEPGSKLLVLGMVIPPSIGNPYNGYINPYYWVEFPIPLLYGNVMGVDRPDRTSGL